MKKRKGQRGAGGQERAEAAKGWPQPRPETALAQALRKVGIHPQRPLAVAPPEAPKVPPKPPHQPRVQVTRRTAAPARPLLARKSPPSLRLPADSRTLPRKPAGADGSLRTSASQLANERAKEERELVVGFDFGTSTTKIIIRDSALSTAYAIAFPGIAPEGHPYLLPATVCVDNSGTFDLLGGDYRIADLKLRFVRDPDEAIVEDHPDLGSSRIAVIAHIALALAEARGRFFKAHGTTYQNVWLLWSLHLGIPSRDYDDERLVNEYDLVALAGWRASTVADEITVESCSAALDWALATVDGRGGPLPGGALAKKHVAAYPEVIAEVIGYAKSKERRPGLHLLVDVGASTVDVATFVIRDHDGALDFSILTAEVAHLGALVLHQQRTRCVVDVVQKRVEELASTSEGWRPLPPLQEYLPDKNDKALLESDRKIGGDCGQLIHTNVRVTREKRYPEAFQPKFQLPTFLCGGGSQVQLYEEALQRAERDTHSIRGFETVQLRRPQELVAPELAPNEYKRLAVAYGLSFPAVEIGEIRPPRKIDDVETARIISDWSDRYISKDMM